MKKFLSFLPIASALDVKVMMFSHSLESVPVPNCQNISQFLDDPLLRPLAGLNAVGRELFERSKTQKPWTAATDIGMCTIKSVMTSNSTSAMGGLCDCTSRMMGQEACRVYSDLFGKIFCFSQYASTKPCEDISSFPISSKCQVTLAGDISPLDLVLRDLTYKAATPRSIPIDVVNSEGRSYYFAWKAIANAQKIFEAVGCASPNEILPGWTRVMTLHTAETGVPDLPVVFVAQRDVNNFMVVVRSAATSTEGNLAASSQPAFSNLAKFPGTVVEGGSVMSRSVLPALEYFFSRWIEAAVVNSPSGTTASSLIHPRIIVLGQGVVAGPAAAYIAASLEMSLNRPYQAWHPTNFVGTEANKIKMDLITFNAGPVGDGTFVAHVSKSINSRNIKIDLASNFPCGSMATCSEADAKIPTGLVTGKFSDYVELMGQILVTNKEINSLAPNSIWDTPAAPYETAAQNVCAVGCWLSQRFCDDEAMSMCDKTTCPAMFSI